MYIIVMGYIVYLHAHWVEGKSIKSLLGKFSASV